MRPYRLPTAQARTVLVIDDCDSIRIIVGRWLSACGYEVLSAASAEEALAILDACRIDVALCDVRFPEGPDGLWLAGEVASRYPATIVVFATGLGELDAQVTLRDGVAGYLIKPFDREELVDTVEHALAVAALRRPCLARTERGASVIEAAAVHRLTEGVPATDPEPRP